jgi:hypothetical protein
VPSHQKLEPGTTETGQWNLEFDMKIKMILPLTAAGLFAASAASAQVAASFDNLVDQVLGATDTDFISASVNLAAINGSIDITAGSDNTPGDTASDSSTSSTSSIDETVSNAIDNSTLLETSDATGSTSDAVNAIDNSVTNAITNTTDSTTEASSEAFAAVTQNFGDVSSVAAGAINDSTATITETGSLASVDINTNAINTAFSGVASNTTGGGIGSVSTAVNLGGIDGSISMALTNANVGATSIGSVAAGSINTSDITATFVGGSDATTNVNAPTP